MTHPQRLSVTGEVLGFGSPGEILVTDRTGKRWWIRRQAGALIGSYWPGDFIHAEGWPAGDDAMVADKLELVFSPQPATDLKYRPTLWRRITTLWRRLKARARGRETFAASEKEARRILRGGKL